MFPKHPDSLQLFFLENQYTEMRKKQKQNKWTTIKKLFYVHSVLHPSDVLSLEESLFPFGEIFHMNVTAISLNCGHTFVIVIVSR